MVDLTDEDTDETLNERLKRFGEEFYIRNGAEGRLVTGIDEVFSRSYWSRVWVVQEIVLGRYAWVICGHEALAMQYLKRLSWYAQYSRQYLHDSTLGLEKNHFSKTI